MRFHESLTPIPHMMPDNVTAIAGYPAEGEPVLEQKLIADIMDPELQKFFFVSC